MGDPLDSNITRAASDWVVRHDRGLSQAETEAFERWKMADARHREAFSRIAARWRAMDRIAAVPALAALADAAEANARLRRSRRRVWMRVAGGLGLAAAAALAIFIGRRQAESALEPLSTVAAPGQYLVLSSTAHALMLADGSVAQLNGDSGVTPEFLPAERRVTLQRGEADFHVAKNPTRPFIVAAGPITVRAVGTVFDVRLSPDRVEVLVSEGKVALGSATRMPTGVTLVAGERAVAHLGADGRPSVTVDRPAPHELDDALAWESTRLVFDETPLPQVVEAFNRFNSEQLVLSDASLNGRTLTGTFRADNLEAFARLLRAGVDVAAHRAADGRIILNPAGQ